MKTYWVGFCENYQWKQLRYIFNSIKQNQCSFEKFLFVYTDLDDFTTSKLKEHNVCVERLEKSVPLVIERHQRLSWFCKRLEESVVLSTDVGDVLFQNQPDTEVLSSYGLIAASECMFYQEEPWNDGNLKQCFPSEYKTFCDKEICNAGTICGKSSVLGEFGQDCYDLCIASGNSYPDQSAYNILLHSKYKSVTSFIRMGSGWSCQLGTVGKLEYRDRLLEEPPFLLNGRMVNSQGKPFSIVHQYNRVPEAKRLFEGEYGQQ